MTSNPLKLKQKSSVNYIMERDFSKAYVSFSAKQNTPSIGFHMPSCRTWACPSQSQQPDMTWFHPSFSASGPNPTTSQS